jgi:hypothetical protein
MKHKLQLVTPEFVEKYFIENPPEDMVGYAPRAACSRIEKRIECPKCNYPASESHYWLSHLNPGLASGPGGKVVRDPGCKYEQ